MFVVCIENLADIWVVQCRNESRFLLETLAVLLIGITNISEVKLSLINQRKILMEGYAVTRALENVASQVTDQESWCLIQRHPFLQFFKPVRDYDSFAAPEVELQSVLRVIEDRI